MPSVATAQTGYESLQGALVGLQVLLFLIAFIMCALRSYSRILIVRSLARDDYIMIVATTFSLGMTVNASIGAMYGWGLHTVDVLPEDFPFILLISWVSQLMFTLATTTVKISILSFYLRLANTRTYRIIIQASIVWLCIWCLTFLLAVILQCNPPSAYWIPSPEHQARQCVDADPALLVNGVTNTLNDLFVYILPMPMLWKIQLPKKQRIGLIALFSIGSIVCVAGAIRLYYSIVVNDGPDGTWWGFNLWTWEAVEVDLGIACACAPALKPLLIRCFPKLMSSVFGRTSNSSRNGRTGNNGTFIPMNNQRSFGPHVMHNVTISGSAGKVQKDRFGDILVNREWSVEEALDKPRETYTPKKNIITISRIREAGESEERLTDKIPRRS